MFDRVYVEIGNVCNLSCSFCPKTKREARRMSVSEFELLCQRLRGAAKYLYFHVMGEPLFHPDLASFLEIAERYGYLCCITTNGTLLSTRGDILLSHASAIHRVSISLHAPEGNGADISGGEYLGSVISFGKALASLDKNVVYRLWNLDTDDREGMNSQNKIAEEALREAYPEEWLVRYSGYRLAYRTFLEYDGIFTWPSESEAEPCENGRCHALKRQIAILADGTVVPCCLDSEGAIPLGNIFESKLSEILANPLAAEMRKGFSRGVMVHPLCKSCTYARRFQV